MLVWNLNLLVTFLWLLLSAMMLLSGIWLLIDGNIDLPIVNFILDQLYPRDRSKSGCYIPKSYSFHFYVFGLIINCIVLVKNFSYFLVFILFLMHICRRLYECMYVQRFQTKINFLYYFFGFIHYPCAGLTIMIDYKYSLTNFNYVKYCFAVFLFLSASYLQYHVHLALANMNRTQKQIYPIPKGHWMFDYFSCPHYLTEIVIYYSFFIASHKTPAMASLFVWIFVNQSLLALINHRWYCRHYRESYPSTRSALIPFIL